MNAFVSSLFRVASGPSRIATLVLTLAVPAFTATPAVRAAELAAVPMQGGMVMPMFSYHADRGTLEVMLDPTIPQLTPLRVSNPGDSFAAGDPWFDALDPSRQSLAFSRRYGFVMGTMTDPLPAGTALWLRKIAASPELGFYRYRNTDPKAWEPIFGTAGSPAAWLWNGAMFHPAVTAPAVDGELSATFDAYLGDAATGAPVAGTTTPPFVLRFTSVSDGRPALVIAQKVAISWAVTPGQWVLETANAPTGAAWTRLTETPVTLDGRPTVLLEPAAVRRFYRLTQVP